MEGMIMTAQLLLSLSILIVVHEWGHFITARTFGIRVEKFYLFFDFLFPMANVLNFSLIKFKKGDTEYGIGWFPLGGYVKIAGMVDESMDKEAMKAPAQPWEFRSKKPWQRLIVMLGGIIVNVVVGVLIFIGLTFFLGDTYIPNRYVNEHGGIYALDLAQQLGLQTGDKFVNINGRPFEDFLDVAKPDALLSQNSYYTILRGNEEVRIDIPGNFIENFNKKSSASNFVSPRIPAIVGVISPESEVTTLEFKTKADGTVDTIRNTKVRPTIAKKIDLRAGDRIVEVEGSPITYQDELLKVVKGAPRDSISFKIQRDGQVLSFKEDFRGRDMIGFLPQGLDKKDLAYVNYSFGESIGLGTERAFGIIFVQLKAFKKLLTGQLSFTNSLSGPVGMARAFGSDWDWERFWHMTGMLSMVLAFMNLLPIPGLDGGYVMFLLYEMVSGREPSEKVFETALKIGMAILLVLMVFVFYNDIAKVITGNL
ncbi:MAG TPA: RIP metalloprotease RseP [Cyclobacteriaceae bacterium]|nr:RIP metalloprotease RseP [Cyclobacteriaceae bacterium]